MPCWIKKLAADSIQEKREAGEREEKRKKKKRERKDPRWAVGRFARLLDPRFEISEELFSRASY